MMRMRKLPGEDLGFSHPKLKVQTSWDENEFIYLRSRKKVCGWSTVTEGMQEEEPGEVSRGQTIRTVYSMGRT